MKLIRVFVIATVLLCASCKKKGTVSGRVTNLWDDTPVEGLEIMVSYWKDATLNYKSGKLALVYSDANGEFTINATYKSNKKYHYQIQLNSYDNLVEVQDTVSEAVKTYYYHSAYYKAIDAEQDNRYLDRSKSQYFEFKVVPTARLHIVVKDQPPINSGAFPDVEIDDANMGYPAFRHDELGSDLNAGIYKYVVPINGEVMIKWTVNGTLNVKSIPLMPFKKTTYYLNY